MTETVLHKSGKAAREHLFFGFLFTYEFAFFGEFSSFAAMNGYFSFFRGKGFAFCFSPFCGWDASRDGDGSRGRLKV